MQQKFFDIVQEGRFDPKNIKVNWAKPGSTLKWTPESEAYLSGKWAEHIARGNKPWPNDLKPKRVRLSSFEKTDAGAEILLDPCVRYYDSLGSNSPEFEKLFGSECVPNALAVSVFIETADNKMAISVRNEKTDYKPLGYHASIGGYFEFWTDKDPTSAAYRELDEEMGLKKDDLVQVDCIGAAYDKWAAHTDIIYHAKTGLSGAEVLVRKHDDENVIKMVPNNQDNFERFIGGFMHANVVIPMATLLMIGTERYGYAWRRSMCEVLDKGSECYGDPKERNHREAADTAAFQRHIQGL